MPDSDADGYADEIDCAPDDPTLPGFGETLEEVCNGEDDDEDCEIDEGCDSDSTLP